MAWEAFYYSGNCFIATSPHPTMQLRNKLIIFYNQQVFAQYTHCNFYLSDTVFLLKTHLVIIFHTFLRNVWNRFWFSEVSGLLVYVAHCGFVLVLCVARAMWCRARGRRGVVQCAWHVWCGGALINVAIPATIPFIPPSCSNLPCPCSPPQPPTWPAAKVFSF